MTASNASSMRAATDMGAPRTEPAAAAALSTNVLDAAPVAMALTDDHGVIRWANHALARLVAATRRQSDRPTVPPALPPRREQDDAASVDGEHQWTRPDGTVRWVERGIHARRRCDGVPVTVDGRRCSILQIVDITDIKEIRSELERSNRELTQFAYVASHDLSEPLRVIAGHVDLLARRYQGRLDDDAERWIGFAVDGCTRMRQLIDDMLDYSRYGRTHDKHHPVDLNDVVTRARKTTFGDDEEAPSPDIEVGDLPVVLGSASELERVFSNLLANAARFVRPGVASQIRIEASRAGDTWLVTVTDNGIGIPTEHADRVFGLFQRLHRQEDYPGTGIGLAICRKIIELHRGRIWVEAAPDGGSRFCIELPASVTTPKPQRES